MLRGKAYITFEGRRNGIGALHKYMHKIRFPVDISQVINIAWAIDLRRNHETRVFKESGPSLKWWRGFKKRHPELSLRKTELIDRGRYDNATEGVINEYFDVLEETLGNSDLTNKPHMVFNCDEASLALNKSSRKVLVPRNSKHCHTIATASSQHMSILCCASAAGQVIPPLIVFSKGMPSGRSFQNEGPVNASYSHSDSGFVDRNMYVEWFTKVFVKHIPSERPAILLQDGATIHISPELIDAAIENNVILLCFPPKLTHILQPCDVVMFRKMRAEISNTMRQIKMLRGDMWVSKNKVPAVFREVCDRSFTPALIKEAFRKCGIYPLNRSAIEIEFVKNQQQEENTNNESSNPRESDASLDIVETSGSIEFDVIADITLDVVSPSEVPAGSEIVATNESQENNTTCPPIVALRAVEMALTPRKKASYTKKKDKGITDDGDPVYNTWRYLKDQVDGQTTPRPLLPNTLTDDHPLVSSGLVPKRLASVFLTPGSKEKGTRRNVPKAKVITSQEIADEIREKDLSKKRKLEEKENRKKARLEKKATTEKKKSNKGKRRNPRKKTVPNRKSSQSNFTRGDSHCTVVPLPNERQRYFSHLQAVLGSCITYEAMKLVCPKVLPYALESNPPTGEVIEGAESHQVSQTLLNLSFPSSNLKTVSVLWRWELPTSLWKLHCIRKRRQSRWNSCENGSWNVTPWQTLSWWPVHDEGQTDGLYAHRQEIRPVLP